MGSNKVINSSKELDHYLLNNCQDLFQIISKITYNIVILSVKLAKP